jgi:hypothetical protein
MFVPQSGRTWGLPSDRDAPSPIDGKICLDNRWINRATEYLQFRREDAKVKFACALICLACLCGFGFASEAAVTPGRCALPADLQTIISQKYPASHIVTQQDLDDYDRKLFRHDFGARCPGLVQVNFYGDGKPTLAMVLVSGSNPHRKAELVVAHRIAHDWELRSIETTDGNPVVWRQGPRKYRDMYGEKTIRAAYPVIVFVGYGSWAVLYAWTGKGVVHVQLSD